MLARIVAYTARFLTKGRAFVEMVAASSKASGESYL
jgi:hypothetical protein